MSRPAIQVRKYAILFHRWLGVSFCVLFALWFVSGIVMMYWTYPEIGAAERLAHAAPIDASRIRFTPDLVIASLQLGEAPRQMRLFMLDGRPAYSIRSGAQYTVFADNGQVLDDISQEMALRIASLQLGEAPRQMRLFMFDGRPAYSIRSGAQYTVFADNGQRLDDISQEMALRIASSWTGQPPTTARFEGYQTEEDQWTVSQEFRPLRPLLKYSWPSGDEVYVSGVTGEVVQHTTRASRTGSYFGAIPHWLYFTPLRKNGPLWDRVVVWSSGIGTVMALLGLVIGFWFYSPSRKQYRFPQGPSSIPYAGQKRWHTVLGLLFGLVTCTWSLSGMLSMEPFEWLSGRPETSDVAAALRGPQPPLSAFVARPPVQAVSAAAPLKVKELVFTSFAGEPVYLAREAPGRSLIIPIEGPPRSAFDRDRIARLVAGAVRPQGVAEVRLVQDYEAYYVDRHHERPLPVLFVRLNDPERSMYYIDLRTARIVASYSAGSRWNRWLYHGLHSMDLPWLYRYRPAWDILVLALMLGGTALCVTSLVIAWRRLHRKWAMWRVARRGQAAAAARIR